MLGIGFQFLKRHVQFMKAVAAEFADHKRDANSSPWTESGCLKCVVRLSSGLRLDS